MTPPEATLQAAIATFDRWHYRFEFDDGTTTPIFDNDHINRHEQRRRYFFEALLRVTGGSLHGHRVLDLGCNAGFWSLAALDAGAEFVLGIDGRQMHIDQANLVMRAKDVDQNRYRFEQANIFEPPSAEPFDVVLCLGLMYHVAKPTELFELIARSGADLVVIDTEISPAPGSWFKLRREQTDEPRNAVDYNTVMVPTRQAVIDLATQFGYTTVPLKLNMTDYAGMTEYRDGWRLAFICSSRLSLAALDRQPPARPLRRTLGGARASVTRMRRAVRNHQNDRSPAPDR